jgi:predicted lysophospholipase L1 biosynthesis ABC-type transport system permease subunit
LARRADPDLGFQVDTSTVVLGGIVAAVLLGGLVAGVALWRVRRGTSISQAAVSRSGRAAADLGVPASVVTGLSLASGTPGRPGRIAVGGTLLSVLGVLAALVFSFSIDRLRQDPDLYGWGWDAAIEGADLTDLGDDPSAGPALEKDHDVVAASKLYSQVPITLDGTPTIAMAVESPSPALEPSVVRGEAPKGADELAVGGDTLEAIGASIGDSIEVSLGEDPHQMLITGVVALPVPEDGGSAATGAYLSPASVSMLDVPAMCIDSDSCTRTIAVGLRPDADVEAFAARYADPEAEIEVTLPVPPGEIDRLTAVEDLPRYMAIFMAALAAAAISFATTTTVRQRRRDLAVLRVLGMTARHIRSVVVVLVLALTGLGALLGGVLGIIVGRQVWKAVMGSVSLPFSPSLPVAAVVLVPVAVVVLAQLVATGSRRSAGRIPAALVLRTE